MTEEKTIDRILPKSDEEVEITVQVTGADGSEIKVDIETPSPHAVSDRTKAKYSDHRWTGAGRFWYDVLSNSIKDYEVHYSTYTTNSGNVGLTSCYVQFNYFDDRDIEGTIEQLLRALDQAIMTENKRQELLDESAEVAQKSVCEDIIARIERIDL